MNKVATVIISAISGVILTAIIYNKGRNDGISECKRVLQVAIDTQEVMQKKEKEEP